MDRRKVRRRNRTLDKLKRLTVANFKSKFESLRKEIKAGVKKQHDLFVNSLVGDVEAKTREFYRYINIQ